MIIDIDEVLAELKHLLCNNSFNNTIRRRQRSAVNYLGPLLHKANQPTYGLIPEKQVDISAIKKALENLTGLYVFSLIAVNTRGLRTAPDWASYQALNSTLGSLLWGRDNSELGDKISELERQLPASQLKELHRIRRILRLDVLPELARSLSNDIGGFRWRTRGNGVADGPLSILKISLLPTMYIFLAAVKCGDWDLADKALALLNQLRFALPIGDKAVSPKSWYLLTAP
ncbi:hypothetical protein KKF05_02540 [Patescibacteria group bacterium]|nr:hypothetical protein [Patescibacteria group bacterium]MBU1915864.1 hypothetical protein [Patescibacteria group bacterium]